MRHDIPIDELGAYGQPMADAVRDCVHCGFCLPTCPTYQVLGQEMDSPRGRILLMKEALEGNLPIAEAMPYVDRCLGCMACETSCPSGVRYSELINPFRDHARRHRARPWGERWRRALLLATLPYPKRLLLASRLGRLAAPFARLLPRSWQPALELLPKERLNLKEASWLTSMPAQSPRRARVALLTGCAQQVLAPEINLATLVVLSRNGVEVVMPEDQVCCGSLSWHVGAADQARRFARQNLAAFPRDVDAVLTTAAGCGSGMKDYGLMFRGQPEESEAMALAERVEDATVFLARLGLVPVPSWPSPIRVAYHDACHLAHAQGKRREPRQLLAAIPNVELVEIPDAEICCGSAGTYNLEQPRLAAELGTRKAANILTTQADMVVAANVGCLVQIRAHLRTAKRPSRLLHPMELLAHAYARENG